MADVEPDKDVKPAEDDRRASVTSFWRQSANWALRE